jgi:hypothetical protein
VKVELRAITMSFGILESAVMLSSLMPSAKKSCFGSPEILVKGRTAMAGLSGSGRAGIADLCAPARAVAARR